MFFYSISKIVRDWVFSQIFVSPLLKMNLIRYRKEVANGFVSLEHLQNKEDTVFL